LNCLQQGLALNSTGPQELLVSEPVLSLALVATGSFYGWSVVDDWDLPAGATPAQLFPRWRLDRFDDPDEADKRRDNRAVLYGQRSLRWLTPLERYRRRGGQGTPPPVATKQFFDPEPKMALRKLGSLDVSALVYFLPEDLAPSAMSYYVDMARTLWRPIMPAVTADVVDSLPGAHLLAGKLWMPKHKPATTNAMGTTVIPLPDFT
jgi:hypothetical protein